MFDLEKLEKNRKKSIDVINASRFHQFIHEDLIDRLEPINKEFDEILIIEPAIENMLIEHIKNISSNSNITAASAQNKNLPKNQFDLIIFPLGFHWIADVQEFLVRIKSSLKSDGIFICNFPGGGSLRNLRRRLIELEAASNKSHTAHISPFIQFEHITPLLQQAGFIENIIDMETLELEHDSPLSLMKALKSHGESNILNPGATYSITKKMYTDLKHNTEEPFSDLINFITFISSPKKNSIKLKSKHYLG
jgi:NADH dehydrogenase [ubiquinone] 1 alpha subcomplex assembly factor 5